MEISDPREPGIGEDTCVRSLVLKLHKTKGTKCPAR